MSNMIEPLLLEVTFADKDDVSINKLLSVGCSEDDIIKGFVCDAVKCVIVGVGDDGWRWFLLVTSTGITRSPPELLFLSPLFCGLKIYFLNVLDFLKLRNLLTFLCKFLSFP